jgi:hypothetical protein
MIAQLLNRNFLASRLDEVVQLLDQSRQDLQSGKSDARAESLGITVDDIEQSRAEVEVLSKRGIEKTDLQSVCIARDPVTSIVQSALEAFYEEAHAVDRPPVQGLAPVHVHGQLLPQRGWRGGSRGVLGTEPLR